MTGQIVLLSSVDLSVLSRCYLCVNIA